MKAIITSIREHIGLWVFKGKRLLRRYDYEVYINRGYFGDMIMEYIGILGY